MSGAPFRLRVLALHLHAPAFSSDAEQDVNTQPSSICQQECATVCTLKYARPSAPNDVLFALPSAEGPSSSHLEALGAANDTLDSLRTTAPDIAASSSSSVSFAQNSSQPLFARPEVVDALVSMNQKEQGTKILHAFSSNPGFSRGGGGEVDKKEIEKSPVATSGHWAPQASVIENEFGYVLQAVLPGVNAKEVRAELLPGRRLVISGIRHHTDGSGGGGGGARPALFSVLPEVFGEPGLNRVVHGGHVLESGRFRLVWKLPKDANQDSIRADFKDGCMLVSVTKESVFSLF